MARNRTRLAVIVGLVLLTVLAGCSGGGVGGGGDGARANGGDGGSGGGDAAPAAEPDAAGASADSASAGQSLPALQQREIVYTGRVVLEVEDFEATRRNLTEAVRARGGFVSDSRARLHRVEDARYRTGEVVLRVPRENFSAMMSRAEADGTVVDSRTSSQDVTDQLVDVEARLESLRAERERLRELFEDAERTEAVLAVERRLSQVQTEIERLEAQRQSLERRVAFSTITVELREDRPDPAVERWYDVGVVGAFLESVDGVVVTIRAVAVGLAYAVPYIVVFGAPVALVGYVARRRRWAGG